MQLDKYFLPIINSKERIISVNELLNIDNINNTSLSTDTPKNICSPEFIKLIC